MFIWEEPATVGSAIHGQVVLAYIRKHTEQTRENKSMVIFPPVLAPTSLSDRL